MCGNVLIITLVMYSKTLHIPMYFFLAQLSVADFMLITDIAPIILLQYKKSSVLFSGCLAQYFFFCFSEASECFVLMVMSYDRYLAICAPLHYGSIMNRSLCIILAVMSWLLSGFIALIMTLSISQLWFCGPNVIDHFFCDFLPLLELSCSDTSIVQIIGTLLGIPVMVLPFLMNVISYINIVMSILKFSSSQRKKAFSTCSSHLTVVTIFYGTLISIYMLPKEGQSLKISKILAMLYTVFTPFLNPFIYSLRNKDIKKALKSIWLHHCA
ncbi:olfactory receptor 1468-like [Gastrophryne carolinensis]